MLENKKPIITLLCINALLAVVLIFSSFQSQPTQTKVEFVDDPLAKNKSDALLTLLQDSIELACKVHYKSTGKGLFKQASPMVLPAGIWLSFLPSFRRRPGGRSPGGRVDLSECV